MHVFYNNFFPSLLVMHYNFRTMFLMLFLSLLYNTKTSRFMNVKESISSSKPFDFIHYVNMLGVSLALWGNTAMLLMEMKLRD